MAANDEPVETAAANLAESNVFEAIERLGELFEKGILSSDEFQTKKTELLQRL